MLSAMRRKGLGKFPAHLAEEAQDYLLAASGGDARVILNALEIGVLTTAPDSEGIRKVDLEARKGSSAAQVRAL